MWIELEEAVQEISFRKRGQNSEPRSVGQQRVQFSFFADSRTFLAPALLRARAGRADDPLPVRAGGNVHEQAEE